MQEDLERLAASSGCAVTAEAVLEDVLVSCWMFHLMQSVQRALLSFSTGLFQSVNFPSPCCTEISDLRVKQAPPALQEHRALGLLQGCDRSSAGSHHPGETSPNSQIGQSWNLPGERGEDFTLNCLSGYRQRLDLIGENSQPLAVNLSGLQSKEPW
ncbi:hypothetical protein IHE44_0003871 [Lamprotornis superbus]|uniref:Uncharacterized protein n=1 Tax=Lamprotornis superbus TaxID=245042 RepID=A0A835NW38_9PASS|nr:hypothetical protein IHE44_0003871 [Lamprotornis superbus]